MVVRLVAEPVVVTVQAHPVDRSVLAAEGPAGSEHTLDPPGRLETAMAEQPVITQSDAEAGGHVVENEK